jgi:beta-lactamase regulating signal transducer with metallopeptidase domain
MRSTPELHAVSAFAGFLLQTLVGWLLCILLARLASSPRRRFQVWIGMILAFTARWAWVLADLLDPHFPAASGIVRKSALVPLAPARAVAVPPHWTAWLPQILTVVVCLYLTGVVWFASCSALRHLRMRRALRYRVAPSPALEAEFASCLGRLGRTSCRLWILPGLASPATLGWRHPQVLVPSDCEAHEPEQLREAFWHELKHIERRDALWNGLARLCQALLWFHPAMHSALSSLAVEREVACDLAVVHDHPQSRESYAACLLRFARLSAASGVMVTGTALELASAAVVLETRIRAILAEEPEPSRWSNSARAAASLFLFTAAAACCPALRILLEQQPALLAPAPRFASTGLREVALPLRRHMRPRSQPAVANRLPDPLAERLSNQPSVAPANPAQPGEFPLEPTQQLAAQHRIGMQVVTEGASDEDDVAEDRAAGGEPAAGEPKRNSALVNASLAAVAIGAAEQIGLLAGDRGRERDSR